MDITPYYRLPEKSAWQGRKDADQPERFFQVVALQNFGSWIKEERNASTPAVPVIVGFACDEGVRRNQGRIGAKDGPLALRRALANFPIHGKRSASGLIDLGDIVCAESNLEAAQNALAVLVAKIIEKKCFPIVLGGGHETAWGHYQGLAKLAESQNFAIVNFDAHFDMRPLLTGSKGSSGTSFLQIALDRQQKHLPFHYYCIGINKSSNTQSLYRTAEQWQVNYLTCDEIYADPAVLATFIQKILFKHDVLYVSICLDAFAGCYAPGVSAKNSFGLQPQHVISALQQLAQSNKVVALDVVELAPALDQDNLTEKLGALCIAEFLYS